MKVYFAHGKESGPWGAKIKLLASRAEEQGYSVESIDYSDLMNPEQRVQRLVDALKTESEKVLLVGSSMGGYVSLVASEKASTEGVFLLAPALYLEGYQVQNYQNNTNVTIVHGWSDEVIPFENSVKYARQADCTLHLISGDHRLNDSLDQITILFSQFLEAHHDGR
ncbi:YqiA/YcfP family alpha/beta fold hydrolase [Litoribrevibacter euphylliae]|uniref:YqiA/YcfP family alpha/beta fold hydrolase n=1 Tax=Litoribrevibacter euphylliae TaxID=1834034 RepID=A0ABV7HPG9_9GAMM